MNASVSVRWPLLFAVPALLVCLFCKAQVVDPITAVKAPVPGVGHNYIGTGTDAVNPADGSVTFDLPLSTPSGRQLSFPFGVHYSSLNPFYITSNGGSLYFYWQTATGYGDAPPFVLNGWSYQLPNYVAQAFVVSAHQHDNAGQIETNYCWAGQDYRFEGFGRSHTLYAGYQWPDPNNQDPQFNSQDCMQPSMSGLGDDGVAWGFGSVTGNFNSGEQPPLTVTDRFGTVYQFPQGPAIENSPTSGMSAPFGALAQTITDRNGNQIVLNGTSTVSAGGGLPAGSYTDTLGRPIVSWTGIGNSAGDQLTVSGLSAIVVKWTTTTATFPDGAGNTQFVLGSTSSINSSNCTFVHKSISMSVVSEIDLPNGQKYSFIYGGAWGRLIQITFPNGGYVQYTWGTNAHSQEAISSYNLNTSNPLGSGTEYCWSIIDTPVVTDRYVSYDGSTVALHQHFEYSTNWDTNPNSEITWTSKQTTVTSTDLISGITKITKYTYVGVPVVGGPNDASWQDPSNGVPVEQQVLHEDGSGNVLRTVNKTWMNQFAMVGDQTILDNEQGITTLRCYDYYDRVLGIYEYNFQSAGPKPSDPTCAYGAYGTTTLSGGLNTSAIGPLLRQTLVAYHSFANTNILDEPDSVTVEDGSGNEVKQTIYQYDQTAVAGSGTALGLVSPPGLRGNATSVSTWLNTTGSGLTTTYKYFDTGQIQSITSPCGNTVCPDVINANATTTYSYSDNFASGYGSPTGQTNAYVTQITYPDGTKQSYTYNYSTGELATSKDPNGQVTGKVTQYFYNDPLNRLRQIDYPDGGETSISYDDTAHTVTTSNLLSEPSGLETHVAVMDGFGHVVQTELTTDPDGTDYVNTTYNGMGLVDSVTNPFRGSAPPSNTTTFYTYDALGRKTVQTQQDGSTLRWIYSGTTVDFYDETGRHWTRTSDALGRLTQVEEPDPSNTPTIQTDYQYDALGNLLRVDQWGGAEGNSGDRVRTFSYDSLSRLVCASNPENSTAPCPTQARSSYTLGTTGYSYDANGNVSSKTSPAPNSSSGSITTNYTYDEMNRILAKITVDGYGTPAECYQYGQPGAASNEVGRLVNEWTQSSTQNGSPVACPSTLPSSGTLTSKSLSYDPMGRIISEETCVYPNCTTTTPEYPLTYTYDLAGDITSYTNGVNSSGNDSILFTNTYDGAERLSSITSTWSDLTHSGTLFSSPSYDPASQLTAATYGTGLTLTRTYDNRLRITGESDHGGIVQTATPGTASVDITGAEQTQ